jgi:hypothetical protein
MLKFQEDGKFNLAIAKKEINIVRNHPRGLKINPINDCFSTAGQLLPMIKYNNEARYLESVFLNRLISAITPNTIERFRIELSNMILSKIPMCFLSQLALIHFNPIHIFPSPISSKCTTFR